MGCPLWVLMAVGSPSTTSSLFPGCTSYHPKIPGGISVRTQEVFGHR